MPSCISDKTDLCHSLWLCMNSEFLGHFSSIHKQILSTLQTEQRLQICVPLALHLLVLLRSCLPTESTGDMYIAFFFSFYDDFLPALPQETRLMKFYNLCLS